MPFVWLIMIGNANIINILVFHLVKNSAPKSLDKRKAASFSVFQKCADWLNLSWRGMR